MTAYIHSGCLTEVEAYGDEWHCPHCGYMVESDEIEETPNHPHEEHR